eukprot:TRINITY_DN64385_c0_g1_i1.p1 TRINITY_DN64385_c0_g1~~TRINITY_DN64385_c0_g1_i1.p1  ORF type:complete len:307 (-),score=81.07 TRINITY_DN64385_c0_g1_i1:337-1257(-)
MSTVATVNKAKPRWADLCDSSSENLGAHWADISDSSVESRPSRLLLEDASYEEQSAGASGLSDLLHEGAVFSAEEPRKRIAGAENSPLTKKARKDETGGRDDVEGKHTATDAAAAGSSRNQPQDKIAQLRQLGFEGIAESMLQEQLDLMGGSIQKVVEALEEHKAVEEQAKQRKMAALATEDPVKEKIVKLQQMGFDEPEQVLKATLEEKGGDVQEVVEALLQKRVERPTSELDKRHRIIQHIKERRDNEINYPYFNSKRPREKRIPIREPMTPDPKEDMSKRKWEAEVAYWRESLRKWSREHGGA